MKKLFAVIALAAGVVAGWAQSTFNADFGQNQNFALGVGSSGWAGAYGGNNSSSTFSSGSGQLTISDSGGHWENGLTSGHLLYLSVTGDFTMTSQLNSLSSSSYATAGIGAFDPSVTTGSPTATWIGLFDKGFVGAGPSGGSYLGTRYVVNGFQVDDQGSWATASMPVDFEMTRVGDVFSQYYSTDGVNYDEIDSVTMSTLPATLDVGIWDASYSGNTSTSVFNSFSLTAAPEPSTIALAGLGLTGMLALRRKK